MTDTLGGASTLEKVGKVTIVGGVVFLVGFLAFCVAFTLSHIQF